MVDRDPIRTASGRVGGLTRWGKLNTAERTRETARPRAAFEQRFLDQANGDVKQAETLRKLHYAKMALESAKARRTKAAGPDVPAT
jgi:hypothetical protein